MNSAFTIMEVDQLESETHHQLTELLIRVVEDGASVGFLPPLSYDEAFAYWEDVLGPGVTLWVAVQDGQAIGTVQLQCAMKRKWQTPGRGSKTDGGSCISPRRYRQNVDASSGAESQGRG